MKHEEPIMKQHDCTITSPGHDRSIPARRVRIGWLRAALAVLRSRRDLARLDGRLLDDIGLCETEARTEYKRPVWDVPKTWRR